MENFKEEFELFGKLLEEQEVYLDPACTFGTICDRMGVPEDKFGEYVFANVGLTGDQVLEVYRKTGPSGEWAEKRKPAEIPLLFLQYDFIKFARMTLAENHGVFLYGQKLH